MPRGAVSTRYYRRGTLRAMAAIRSRVGRSGSEKRAREQLVVSGPPGHWDAVRAEAERRGVAVSVIVREALDAYLTSQ